MARSPLEAATGVALCRPEPVSIRFGQTAINRGSNPLGVIHLRERYGAYGALRAVPPRGSIGCCRTDTRENTGGSEHGSARRSKGDAAKHPLLDKRNQNTHHGISDYDGENTSTSKYPGAHFRHPRGRSRAEAMRPTPSGRQQTLDGSSPVRVSTGPEGEVWWGGEGQLLSPASDAREG